MNFLIILLSLFSLLHAIDDSDLSQTLSPEESLFVSLGSYCTTAHWHRYLGVRKAAFPFDWIVSFDGEKLIEIIETDFLHFLSPDFLMIHPNGDLLNTYYHLEFLNEGDWYHTEISSDLMEKFLTKCQRRIDRFRGLADYEGKVFFVRTAVRSNVPLEGRMWQFKETREMSRDYAERLYHALKKRFPKVDFDLVIINECPEPRLEIDHSDHLWIIKTDNAHDTYKMLYSHFLYIQAR